MYERLLVPTDGSVAANAAAKAAISISRQFDTDLFVLHVTDPEAPARVDDVFVREDTVEHVEKLASAADVEVTGTIVDVEDSIPRTIVSHALDLGVDGLVMGTHGRGALDRFVLGSVTERTMAISPLPVLTVHEATETSDRFDRLLVPTDGSACADAGGDHAARLAAATGGELHVVHVVDPDAVWDDVAGEMRVDDLDAAKERAVEGVLSSAERFDVSTVETAVLSGTPYQAIVNYAIDNDIDCIVMGTHGRTGLSRYLLGSVTERVIRTAPVPVVTVKDTDADERSI